MLGVAYKPFMMSVIILNVVMLSVVEPTRALPTQLRLFISAVCHPRWTSQSQPFFGLAGSGPRSGTKRA